MRKVHIFWGTLLIMATFRFVTVFGDANVAESICLKNEVTGSGFIINEPEEKESGQMIVVNTQDLQVSTTSHLGSLGSNSLCGPDLNIRLKTKIYPEYNFGDTIKFSGKLAKPFNFRSEDGRVFNYEGYLSKDDIYYEIKSARLEKQISNSKSSFSLQGSLLSLKKMFVASIDRVLGEPHSALASGLVVGEKAALGKKLLDDFRTVGLIHIVVLSGFNITIVGEALRRMLSRLPRVWGIAVGAAGIILFGILVGGGATVIRSCFMAVVALSADLIRRDYNVVRALSFAGILMLIMNPKTLLFDPSFQLSFLATAGLIILASPIESKLGFITDKVGIRGIVASTLATQIFVSPFILYTMGQISIIGMVVNILVLPFIPITMLAVFLTGFLGMMWYPLSVLFGWLSYWLLSYELFMVENFAKVPYASLNVPKFSHWWVVVFYVVFVVVFVGVKYRKKT